MVEKLKIRVVFYMLMLLVVGMSIVACQKEELESSFPVFTEGTLNLNTTYQLNSITSFDVVLRTDDAYAIYVRGGSNITTSFGKVESVSNHIIINGKFVRFCSSDYDTSNNVERYDNVIIVSHVN